MEFNGTFQTATLGFKPRLTGTVMATSNGDTVGAAFFPSGTQFAGHLTLKLIVMTAGAGGNCNIFIDGGIGEVGNRSSGASNNNAYLSSQATGIAFDTTSPQTIALSSVWGASVASQTVQCTASQFTKKGP
jgi:hypothetical protein